jgi:hypothetical protein
VADEEIPLTGGTVATVVRVGDTVRRTTDRWSDAVHGVLAHLESSGFEGAPRFLGTDERGREILAWIDGTPSTRPWPAPLLSLDGVRALGRLLRRAHDALATYEPAADAEWVTGVRTRRPGEIVTHGDLGLWNVLWRDGEPVAFIDWDFAQPAPPVADLALLGYFATPVRHDEHCRECGFDTPPDRRARLHALCEAYGWGGTVDEVLDAMEDYWERDTELIERLGPTGRTPWAGFHARGIHVGGRELLAWLRANRHLVGSRS